MKNKFLIFTLCFTVFFSSLNFNNSYADDYELQPLLVDGGVISAPMLGVIASVAVAGGIVLNSVDDIYKLGKGFYDKYSDNKEIVSDLFKTAVVVGAHGVITVGSDFLKFVKDYLNEVKEDTSPSLVGYIGVMPVYNSVITVNEPHIIAKPGSSMDFGAGLTLSLATYSSGFGNATFRYNGSNLGQSDSVIYDTLNGEKVGRFFGLLVGSEIYIRCVTYSGWKTTMPLSKDILTPGMNVGGLNWDNVDSNTENDKLPLYIPQNLGNLVGAGSNDVLSGNKDWDLPLDGSVSLPNTNNPAIDVDTSITFPNAGTSDNVGSTTWDWLISLVVPSSAYWSDTFNTFFTNIGNAFPMININRFKDLCINGVPPKDIEVTIMGAKGKIFNTKYLNSIVDWLQPIVSAFMAFLLMLYNYRKVYKLIRGFEPFSGIADGNSVGEVRGKMDGAMPEMGGSSFVGPSTAGTWSDGQSVTRGSIQSRYYGRDI